MENTINGKKVSRYAAAVIKIYSLLGYKLDNISYTEDFDGRLRCEVAFVKGVKDCTNDSRLLSSFKNYKKDDINLNIRNAQTVKPRMHCIDLFAQNPTTQDFESCMVQRFVLPEVISENQNEPESVKLLQELSFMFSMDKAPGFSENTEHAINRSIAKVLTHNTALSANMTLFENIERIKELEAECYDEPKEITLTSLGVEERIKQDIKELNETAAKYLADKKPSYVKK